MRCPNCGKRVKDGANFCPKCGRPIIEPVDQSAPSPVDSSVPSPVEGSHTLTIVRSEERRSRNKAYKVSIGGAEIGRIENNYSLVVSVGTAEYTIGISLGGGTSATVSMFIADDVVLDVSRRDSIIPKLDVVPRLTPTTKSYLTKPLSKYKLQLMNDIAGLPAPSDPVEVCLYADHLEIVSKSANTNVSLDYSKIINAAYETVDELIQQEKSSIARGAVGGFLFGPLGALVGAASGVGTTQTKESKEYAIVTYTDSSDQNNYLQFQDSSYWDSNSVPFIGDLKVFAKVGEEAHNIEL